MDGRALRVAQLASHAHPLVDTRGGRGRPDRPGLLDVVRAVGHRTAAEVVPLVLAGKTLALRGAGHVDQLTSLEEVDLECLAQLEVPIALETDLAQVAMGRDARFLVVPGLRLGDQLFLDRAKAELDRAIAVLLNGPHAHHGAGSGLEHGDRRALTLYGDSRGR